MKPKDDSVNLRGLTANGWWAAHIADQVHQEMVGAEVVITSAKDGKHRVERSAHYRGDAIDVRIWYIEGQELEFVSRVRTALGLEYVVILESDHVHIHWSPTYAA